MNKTKNTTAILMTVRDEEEYIDYNISYHLDLGFDYIFIVNHNSVDKTNEILKSYEDNAKVIVLKEENPVFDHAKIANKLLRYVNNNYEVDWFIFLDVDEFLSIKEQNIHHFIDRLDAANIPYATIGWANALFDYTMTDYTCAPVTPIDTTKYYIPWPERDWQEGGHFRKTIVKNHQNIEIVVGGHYVETANNKEFFSEYHWNPFIIPYSEAKILHFEFRGKAEDIYEKWKKLAEYEDDSTSSEDAPWLERISTIRKYVKEFENKIEDINRMWFQEHRTFWGTVIEKERIIYDTTLARWYRKYFKEKIKSRSVKSVCLVRDRNLGDVIMTEPIARFLSSYVERVCLATDISNANLLFDTYDQIHKYKTVNTKEVDCDAIIKLVYELSDNNKTYIQGYMDSIGFDKDLHNDIPKIRQDWENIMHEKFILLAPFTSSWEESKRSWGYGKYIKLKALLEEEFDIECVILEKEYSFQEMMSLIKHCEFFVGNDSGPAIIAQSFFKKSFVIFGATSPKYLHLSKKTFPIYDSKRHLLCSHNTRQEEIECCEEFCMDRIRVEDVFKLIKSQA